MNRPESMSLDQRLAPAMFWLSVLFLFLLAEALHLSPGLRPEHLEADGAPATAAMLAAPADTLDPAVSRLTVLAGVICGWGLLLLYPLFVVEALVHWRAGGSLRRTLWQCAFPPSRAAARDQTRDGTVWLPGIGWAAVDARLRSQVERGASVPMLIIALMVLPLLAAEHFLGSQIRSNAWLLFTVKASAGLIWMAFTFEFVLMLSLSERKWRYARTHWIDALIVTPPWWTSSPR